MGVARLEDLLNEMRGDKRYLVIGERHPDYKIAGLVIPLLYTGKFKNLFLEALNNGLYNRDGDTLKEEGGVYGWNPLKYDRIISSALKNNVLVYGIDSGKRIEGGIERRRRRGDLETSIWAMRILRSGAPGNSMILTGSGHMTYWKEETEVSRSLPRHMVRRGASENSILTVASVLNDSISAGLYKLKDLPEGNYCDYLKKHEISDYVFSILSGHEQQPDYSRFNL